MPKQKISSIILQIEEQAKSNPDQVAIRYLKYNESTDVKQARFLIHEIKYSQLINQVNRICTHIQTYIDDHGHFIESGDLAILRVCKTPYAVAAQLALMKLGFITALLSPDLPQARLSYIREQLGAKLEINDQLLESFVHIDWSIEDQFKKLSITFPQANKPIFLIYTSGSATGTPNGVLLTDENYSKRFSAIYDVINFDQSKCFISITPFIWDVFPVETHGALTAGATMAMTDSAINLNTQLLLEYIKCSKGTHIQATPSQWSIILANSESNQLLIRQAFANLEVCISGGELLPKTIADKILNTISTGEKSTKLFNFYGPTEATAWSHYAEITDKDNINCGHPLRGTGQLILNDDGEQVADNQEGILYLCGTGISDYFLSDEDEHDNGINSRKTKLLSRYINYEGQRYYCTDDIAAYSADGLLLKNRRDNVVKIRGHRVDLHEIDEHIRRHKAVEQVATVLAADKNGENSYLITFVQPHKPRDDAFIGMPKLRQEIWESLKQHLSPYMIPAAINSIDVMPLLANHKINRNILMTKANQELQTMVLGICERVLGLDSISADDSLADLGVESMLLARIVANVSKVMGLKPINLWRLYRGGLTIKTITDAIQEARLKEHLSLNILAGEASAPSPRAIKHIKRNKIGATAFPVTFSQERLLFLNEIDLDEKGTPRDYNAALNLATLYEIESQKDVNFNINCIKEAVYSLIDTHEILRSTYGRSSDNRMGEYCQVIHQNVRDTALDIQLFDDTEHFESYANMIECFNGKINETFNIYDLIPIRVRFACFNNKLYVLICLHHITTDSFGSNIMNKHLSEYYSQHRIALQQGLKRAVISRNTSHIDMGDIAIFQRAMQKDAQALTRMNLQYWREYLKDYPEPLQPFDNTRHMVTFAANEIHYTIDRDTTRKLVKTASSNQNTFLLIYLLTILKISIHKHTNESDLTIGIAHSERPDQTIDVMGFMVNIIPLRTTINTEMTVAEQALSIKEKFTLALERLLPYQTLIHGIDKGGLRENIPGVKIVLVYENKDSAEKLVLDDCSINKINMPASHCKIPLVFFFIKENDELKCRIEYSVETYSYEKVLLISKQIQHLATSISLQPNSIINDLSLINEDEQAFYRRCMQGKICDTKHKSLVSAFRKQCELYPHDTKMEYGDKTITNIEFHTKAAKLALYLAKFCKREQIKPKNLLVGLALTNTPNRYIAIMACMYLQMTYVPVDCFSRIGIEVIQDTIKQCTIVLSDIETNTFVTATDDSNQYYINLDDTEVLANIEQYNPLDLIIPKNYKQHYPYAITTSGSTGKPKLTIIHNNEAITNLTENMEEVFHMDSTNCQPRVLLNACAWRGDADSLNTYMVLTTRATGVVCTSDELEPGDALASTIHEKKISTIFITHPGIAAVTNPDKYDGFPHLQYIGFAGDVLTIAVAKQWLNNHRIKMLNLCGRTEDNNISCFAEYTPESFAEFMQNQVCDTVPIASKGGVINNYTLTLKHTPETDAPPGSHATLYVSGPNSLLGFHYHSNTVVKPEETICLSVNNTITHNTGDLVTMIPYSDHVKVFHLGRNTFLLKTTSGYRANVDLLSKKVKETFPLIDEVAIIQDHVRRLNYIITLKPEAYDTSGNYSSLTKAILDKIEKTYNDMFNLPNPYEQRYDFQPVYAQLTDPGWQNEITGTDISKQELDAKANDDVNRLLFIMQDSINRLIRSTDEQGTSFNAHFIGCGTAVRPFKLVEEITRLQLGLEAQGKFYLAPNPLSEKQLCNYDSRLNVKGSDISFRVADLVQVMRNKQIEKITDSSSNKEHIYESLRFSRDEALAALSKLAKIEMDVIVASSVIQYFTLPHLVDVLDCAARKSKVIMINDVRNYSLLQYLKASALLHRRKANKKLKYDEWLTLASYLVETEKQLCVDPHFFCLYAKYLEDSVPDIHSVEVYVTLEQLRFKLGKNISTNTAAQAQLRQLHTKSDFYTNDLLPFRYDVILKINWQHMTHLPSKKRVKINWIDWDKTKPAIHIKKIAEILDNNSSDFTYAIRNIPNPRLLPILKTLASKANDTDTLYQQLTSYKEKVKSYFSPTMCFTFALDRGYNVEITYSEHDQTCFDVVFHKLPYMLLNQRDRFKDRDLPQIIDRNVLMQIAKKQNLVNDNMHALIKEQFISSFWQKVPKTLPSYAQPFRTVVLNKLPTDNTKLPNISATSTIGRRNIEYVAPRTDSEAQMKKIWFELFKGRDAEINPGIHDDFFLECGGDSLSAFALLNTINQEYKVSCSHNDQIYLLTLKQLKIKILIEEFWGNPTIEHLCNLIDIKYKKISSEQLSEIIGIRSQHSDNMTIQM